MGLALVLGRGNREREEIGTPPQGPAAATTDYENRLIFSPTPERPDRTPDIIPAESEVIYCFFELSRVPPDAPLTARWWHEDRELGGLELRDLERTAESAHAAGRFSIYPPAGPTAAEPAAAGDTAAAADGSGAPAGGFPPGIYDVELTSPAAPDVVARESFMVLPRAAKILAGGGEPAGPPVIRSLRTASGVTDAGEAIEPAASFTGDGRIYVVFDYAGIPPGAVLAVRWWAGDSEIHDARTEIPVAAAEGRAHAWLEVGEGERLPPGQYRVSVHLGDEDEPLAGSGFSVDGTPTASPGGPGG